MTTAKQNKAKQAKHKQTKPNASQKKTNLSDDNSNDMEREVNGNNQEGQVGDGNPCKNHQHNHRSLIIDDDVALDWPHCWK